MDIIPNYSGKRARKEDGATNDREGLSSSTSGNQNEYDTPPPKDDIGDEAGATPPFFNKEENREEMEEREEREDDEDDEGITVALFCAH